MPSLTADEFIANIADFDSLPTSKQTDLLVLYLITHAGAQEVTALPVASLREALHLPIQARLPQYLSEQSKIRGREPGKYVKTKKGYGLGESECLD